MKEKLSIAPLILATALCANEGCYHSAITQTQNCTQKNAQDILAELQTNHIGEQNNGDEVSCQYFDHNLNFDEPNNHELLNKVKQNLIIRYCYPHQDPKPTTIIYGEAQGTTSTLRDIKYQDGSAFKCIRVTKPISVICPNGEKTVVE